MIARSYLYAPGDSGDRLERSATRGADAVIADLEDAVAPTHKADAVKAVAAWLARRSEDGVQRWVRINAGRLGLDDVRTVFGPGLDGIVIPKVSSAADVQQVAEALDELQQTRRAGNDERVAVMALIETARGLRDVDAIAEHPAVKVLQVGELDLAADLGLSPSSDESELVYARSRVVTASAATGLQPPVAAVSPDFGDLNAFGISTQRLKGLGFVGRAVIHPAQVPTVHDIFTPTPDELETAHRTLAAYEAALSAGIGVRADDLGRMVDEAVVRASRRTVALARKPHRTRQVSA
jgi:citrate lyase subunit beta / citryl-CoA lyase